MYEYYKIEKQERLRVLSVQIIIKNIPTVKYKNIH